MEPPLAGLFPDEGLRRGSVLGIAGLGAMSLLLATLSRPLNEGSWGAVVGMPELGAEAAAVLGVRLDRLALVPNPGPRWPEVVSALLDALDLVVVCPPGRCRPADGRRLAARVRERRRVLVVVAPREAAVLGGRSGMGEGSRPITGAARAGAARAGAARDRPARPAGRRDLRSGGLARWPESVDLQLEVVSSAWHGVDGGDGVLRCRQMTVRSSGRRSGARERVVRLWLPGPDGRLAPADDPEAGPGVWYGPAPAQQDPVAREAVPAPRDALARRVARRGVAGQGGTGQVAVRQDAAGHGPAQGDAAAQGPARRDTAGHGPAPGDAAGHGASRGDAAGWQRRRWDDEDAAVPLPAGGVLAG